MTCLIKNNILSYWCSCCYCLLFLLNLENASVKVGMFECTCGVGEEGGKWGGGCNAVYRCFKVDILFEEMEVMTEILGSTTLEKMYPVRFAQYLFAAARIWLIELEGNFYEAHILQKHAAGYCYYICILSTINFVFV
ncbi:hypothetical protein ACH5RR_035419 [Cinchona calisaya]|uniref:Uncharacterized protein n=1 Tax=Cinchona calisaya TaxID=153742 RepID=A0ABD2Y449_9GENT